MYVIRKLRLNRFKARPCLTPRELYLKHGFSEPQYKSQLTAQVEEITGPVSARKTQQLALAQEIEKKAAQYAADPENTKPLERLDPSKM